MAEDIPSGPQLSAMSPDVIFTSSWQNEFQCRIEHRWFRISDPFPSNNGPHLANLSIFPFTISSHNCHGAALPVDCELADAKGPELVGPPLSLRNMLDQAVKLHAGKDALVSMHQYAPIGQPIHDDQ